MKLVLMAELRPNSDLALMRWQPGRQQLELEEQGGFWGKLEQRKDEERDAIWNCNTTFFSKFSKWKIRKSKHSLIHSKLEKCSKQNILKRFKLPQVDILKKVSRPE